jgi:hypothetical protein
VPDNDALFLGDFAPWEALSEKYFPKPDGTPRTRQGRNDLARRHGIKLARIGHVAYAKEADIVRAMDRLTTPAFEPPRRGRPRKRPLPARSSGAADAPAPAIAAAPHEK